VKKLERDAKKKDQKENKKKTKDNTKPKGASSAYIHYTTEIIPKLKADPKYKGPGKKSGFKLKEDGEEMKHTDFMSIAGEMWNELNEDKKKPYELLA
jgi:hypothetical protein